MLKSFEKSELKKSIIKKNKIIGKESGSKALYDFLNKNKLSP